jgi:hypothetical protein
MTTELIYLQGLSLYRNGATTNFSAFAVPPSRVAGRTRYWALVSGEKFWQA